MRATYHCNNDCKYDIQTLLEFLLTTKALIVVNTTMKMVIKPIITLIIGASEFCCAVPNSGTSGELGNHQQFDILSSFQVL
jgi:hypothetical protein